jgi:hypothetical protein
MKNERKGVRAQRDQLLTLLNGWDPAGLLEQGARRDQYDAIVDKLLSVLAADPSASDVADFLRTEIGGRFGVVPSDPEQFATKALTWYRLSDES